MKGFTLSGKAILIIITAITTAGGFTLGYFVGKNTSTSTAVAPVMPGRPEVAPVVSGTAATKEEAKGAVKVSPDERPVAMPQVKAEEDTGPRPATSRDAGRAEQEPKPTPEKRLYTVQAGAFRNQRDADSLRLKLKKKGYAAYVRSDSSTGITLFKVRIGEFTDKKKAETLARELKKTQGLNAFASVKN